MLLPAVLQNRVATLENFLRASEMHVCRCQERKPAVMMLVVVPVHEFGHEGPRRFDRGEEFGKFRSVFWRFEVRFRERIVVGGADANSSS